MVDLSDDVAALAAGASTIDARLGAFVGIESGRALVDVGGGRIPVSTFGPIELEVNEACHVWFVNGVPFLMGPSALKPGFGTVTAVDGSWVTVLTSAGVHTGPFFSGYTPVVGNIVKIDWSYPAAVAWVLSAVPDEIAPPPAPGGSSGVKVQTFKAVAAGSQYRSGGAWWQPQVWASNSLRGIWVYGSKIPDTIPAGATIAKVEVYVSPAQIFGADPNFATHVYKTLPGGVAGFASGDYPIPIKAGWVTLPVSFGNALKRGGGAFGIGVNQGGFNKFNSLAADPMSGALRIRYTV